MELTVREERFPIAGAFRIARETRTEARVVVAEIRQGDVMGRGEAVPYPRYGETVEGVVAGIEAMADMVANRIERRDLLRVMKAGAVRNALDCALWDFAAKRDGRRVADRLGLTLRPLTTLYTISLGTPDEMAAAARNAGRPMLKVKLGDAGDPDRIKAVRAAVPDATLVVDANEGWTGDTLGPNMAACAAARVALVEQPLPAADDAALAATARRVPVCADESAHVAADLDALCDRYDAINVKLDKAGGLTEALTMVSAAKTLGFQVMLGCMVGTSLGMAPALYAAQSADFVDLDGPLLLAQDRDPALRYEGATVHPPEPALWG